MTVARVLVVGASGSGSTTLGRALADRWSVPHADADDYFWVPTSPPYTTQRPVAERVPLMTAVFAPRRAWVLSGSLLGWGESIVATVDAVVFVTLDPAVRMERLVRRESLRHGALIEDGGPLATAHREFRDWAAGYDDPTFTGRNRRQHEVWLSGLHCPVLRLDTGRPTGALVDEAVGWVDSLGLDH